MSDKPARQRPDLPTAVELRLWTAKFALFWERIWPALWPGLGVIGIFLVLAFLEIWRLVPLSVQALGILALIVGAGFLMWRNLTRLRLPGRDEGLRRLEKDSGLKHRPLTSFDDKPLGERSRDPVAHALWTAHKRNLAKRMRKVGVVWPKSKTAERDPYALRLLLILILGVSVLVAGPDWGNRLMKAVAPFMAPQAMAVPEVSAWIQPPEYTGKPSVFLTGGGPRAVAENEGDDGEPVAPRIEVPSGAKLVVQLSGAGGLPTLRLNPLADGAPRGAGLTFKTDEGIRKAEGLLTEPVEFKIIQRGKVLGVWRIDVVADRAPDISFLSRPSSTVMASLSLNYELDDDYGVVAAKAHITPLAALADGEEALSFDLPLPTPRPGPVEDIALENLAAHEWAGQEVEIYLTAEDANGQSGRSETLTITLPQRVFTSPLARALVEQRAVLAGGEAVTEMVASALDSLSAAPERFVPDTTVFLGMRSAYWRLTHDPETASIEEVRGLLWELALRVEDGGISASLARLRRIQQALMKALAEGASQSEIAQLLAQQRAALEQYMAELMQNADSMPAPEEGAEEVQVQDLGKLLDDLRRMTEVGAHDQARQLLAQLSALLENLRPSNGGQGQAQQGGPPSPQEQALGDAVNKLSDIVSRQRGLLDDTFRSAGPENFEQQPEDTLADIQEILRGGSLMQRRNPPEGADNVLEDLISQNYLNQLLGQEMERRQTPLPPPNVNRSGRPGQASSRQRPADARPSGELARDQSRLRNDLDGIRGALSEAGVDSPGTLGEAGDSMGEAGQALGGDQLVDAYGHQQQALSKLRESAEDLGEQLHQMQQARRGQPTGGQARRGGRPGEDGSDPLGRRSGNGQLGNGERVEIPSETAIEKARRVLNELRRRASERDRPKVELDYLERLLQRF